MIRDCKLCAPGADMFSAADILFFAFMLLSIPSIRSDLCMGVPQRGSYQISSSIGPPYGHLSRILVFQELALRMILVLIDLTNLIAFLFHQSVFRVVSF